MILSPLAKIKSLKILGISKDVEKQQISNTDDENRNKREISFAISLESNYSVVQRIPLLGDHLEKPDG